MASMRLHPCGSDQTWQSPWLESLPEDYFSVLGDHLKDHYLGNAADYSTEQARNQLDIALYVRLAQAQTVFVPWVEEHDDFRDKSILEIGCGAGSSTAVLAMHARRVQALDISSLPMKVARLRCDLLGVSNVEFTLADPDWLVTQRWPVDPAEHDMVVCYALVEHLTLAERLNLLTYIWKRLPGHGRLVIYETPNRLCFYDWHSSYLDFAQILPDDLAAYYYRKSPRFEAEPNNNNQMRKDQFERLTEDETTKLYRWGRGASFHEFELAIGIENLRVVNDGYSGRLFAHRNAWGYNESYEAGLRSVFENLTPSIPAGFARPSLDFVLAPA
jgi:2-polyprenyl-3-methyl-5-hydroxy-6-metoxy-1,4-benzoquinol methylase